MGAAVTAAARKTLLATRAALGGEHRFAVPAPVVRRHERAFGALAHQRLEGDPLRFLRLDLLSQQIEAALDDALRLT